MRDTLIPASYSNVKKAVMEKLSKVTSCSIILDLWSSKSMDGFLGFTCSAVTENYESFTCLLACRKVEGSHTGQRILDEYENVTAEWEISEKVYECFHFLTVNIKNHFNFVVI